MKLTKIPPFEKLKGDFEIEPIITLSGKSVFYDKIHLNRKIK